MKGCEIMEQAVETFIFWYSNGFLRIDIYLLADISAGGFDDDLRAKVTITHSDKAYTSITVHTVNIQPW